MQASEPTEFNNYLENDKNNAKFARDEFMNAFDGDLNDISGEAKVFKEQVDTLMSGDLANFKSNQDGYKKAEQERQEIYNADADNVDKAK